MSMLAVVISLQRKMILKLCCIVMLIGCTKSKKSPVVVSEGIGVDNRHGHSINLVRHNKSDDLILAAKIQFNKNESTSAIVNLGKVWTNEWFVYTSENEIWSWSIKNGRVTRLRRSSLKTICPPDIPKEIKDLIATFEERTRH